MVYGESKMAVDYESNSHSYILCWIGKSLHHMDLPWTFDLCPKKSSKYESFKRAQGENA